MTADNDDPGERQRRTSLDVDETAGDKGWV